MAVTLIQTAKLNGVDPMAWLTDVLERIVSGRTKSPRDANAAAVELASTWSCGTGPGRMIDHTSKPSSASWQSSTRCCRSPARITRPNSGRRFASRPEARFQTRAQSRGSPPWVMRAASVCKLDLGSNAAGSSLYLHHPFALRPAAATGARNNRLSEAPRQTPPSSAVLIGRRSSPAKYRVPLSRRLRMIRIVSQAPSENLAIRMMASATPVAIAPKPLTQSRTRVGMPCFCASSAQPCRPGSV